MGTIDCSSILLMGLGTLMICIIVFDAEFLYDWYEKKIQKIVQNEIYQKQYYRIAKRFCEKDYSYIIFDKIMENPMDAQPFINAIMSYADVKNLFEKFRFDPKTYGIERSVDWIGCYKYLCSKVESQNKVPIPFIQYYWIYYCNIWNCVKYRHLAKDGESYFETCALHRYVKALKEAVSKMPELKPILRDELAWFLNQIPKKNREWILEDKEYFRITKELLIAYEIVNEEFAKTFLKDFLKGKIEKIETPITRKRLEIV